jgi:hypothetical protein
MKNSPLSHSAHLDLLFALKYNTRCTFLVPDAGAGGGGLFEAG